MSSPKYVVDDVVYLAESAKIGAIESYRVSGVRQDATGEWLYKLSVPPRPPINITTIGDRITPHRSVSVDWEVSESELATYCEVLDIAISVLQANLDNLKAKRTAHCSS